MPKYVLTSASVAMLSLFLATACAEDSTDTETTAPDASATEPGTTDSAAQAAGQKGAVEISIMDQPVDFSSPENVEKSLENIRQQAGEKAAGTLKSAIDYMLVYDLSVKRNKSKLYKKLDGKTPNEILALIRR